MSKRNTDDLLQEEECGPEIPPSLWPPTQGKRALRAAHQLGCSTSQNMFTTAPARKPGGHTVGRTSCRCPCCRRRRAHKQAAGAGRQHAPYIDATATIIESTLLEEEKDLLSTIYIDATATVIDGTPQMDKNPGGQGRGRASTWAGQQSQASPTTGLPPHGSVHKKFSRSTICVTAIFLLLTLLFWTSGQGPHLVASLFPSPAATITIIPASSQENATVPVTAAVVPSGANQVAARILQGSSPLRTVVARATGRGQTPASPAQGTLIFYNQGPSAQTIGAGISLTGSDGIEVETEASVTIPAGNPPFLGTAEVGAESVQAGSGANIAAGDINKLCCAAGISVKNTDFSGGQDAQTYPILRQDDIDAAIAQVKQDLSAQAQHQVLSQVTRSEQLAVGPQCHPSVASAARAGSHVVQASISVSDSCSGEAYDRAAALNQAAILFAWRMDKQLGPTYRLVSRVATSIGQARLTDAQHGTITVLVQAQGTWRYQWSRAEQRLIAHRVQGKSVSEALSLLGREAGVAHTSISLSGGAQSIPNDLARITIVILPISGGPGRSRSGSWGGRPHPGQDVPG